MRHATRAQIKLGDLHAEAIRPHQCIKRSDSVNAFHTRSRGGSKTRVMEN
jgi:hypothetical protein